MNEQIPQGGGYKVPFVIPGVPVPFFVGIETEMQGTTEFYDGALTPFVREQNTGWVVFKPVLGAGIADWAGVSVEYEFTDKKSGWTPQLAFEFWEAKLELQPMQVWFKRESERQWDPFVTEYSSAGTGFLIDLKDTMIVLARQQDVIDVGGYQAFGKRYVGLEYQFVEVQAQSHVYGYLKNRFPDAKEVGPRK